MFEKINNEKQYFSAELTKVKNYSNKLEENMCLVDGSQHLVTQIERLKSCIESLKEELERSCMTITSKDDKIVELEKEVDLYKRTLGIFLSFLIIFSSFFLSLHLIF